MFGRFVLLGSAFRMRVNLSCKPPFRGQGPAFRRHPIYFLCGTLISIALFLVCGEGAAWNPESDCPRLPEDSVKAQRLAGELFNAAEQQYQESRPIEALKGFLCSLQIIQHENTLFNIAQIAKLSKHRSAALALLKDFVAHARGSTRVDPIQDIIAELEEETPEGPPEQEAVPPAASAEPEPPPSTIQTDRRPGENPLVSEEAPARKNGMRVAGWVLLGTGAAAAIAGGVFQGMAGSAQKRAESASTYSDFQDAERKMDGFQSGAYAGFIAGGVLLGSGLTLVLISDRGEKATLALAPGPKAVVLKGSF